MESVERLISELESPDESTRRSAVNALADYYWQYPDTQVLRAMFERGWQGALKAWYNEGRLAELVMFIKMDVRVSGMPAEPGDPVLKKIANALEASDAAQRGSRQDSDAEIEATEPPESPRKKRWWKRT